MATEFTIDDLVTAGVKFPTDEKFKGTWVLESSGKNNGWELFFGDNKRDLVDQYLKEIEKNNAGFKFVANGAMGVRVNFSNANLQNYNNYLASKGQPIHAYIKEQHKESNVPPNASSTTPSSSLTTVINQKDKQEEKVADTKVKLDDAEAVAAELERLREQGEASIAELEQANANLQKLQKEYEIENMKLRKMDAKVAALQFERDMLKSEAGKSSASTASTTSSLFAKIDDQGARNEFIKTLQKLDPEFETSYKQLIRKAVISGEIHNKADIQRVYSELEQLKNLKPKIYRMSFDIPATNRLQGLMQVDGLRFVKSK